MVGFLLDGVSVFVDVALDAVGGAVAGVVAVGVWVGLVCESVVPADGVEVVSAVVEQVFDAVSGRVGEGEVECGVAACGDEVESLGEAFDGFLDGVACGFGAVGLWVGVDDLVEEAVVGVHGEDGGVHGGEVEVVWADDAVACAVGGFGVWVGASEGDFEELVVFGV